MLIKNLTKFSCLLLASLTMPASFAGNPLVVHSGPYQKAVVELYTSEGCSSCPPADRWLDQLIKVPQSNLDLLALSFHVDYWDYIGWKDEFASPQYTNRQRRLAAINQQSSIYTPEFFVDGLEARGTHSVLEKIKHSNQLKAEVNLSLTILPQDHQYHLELTSQTSKGQSYKLQFVVFEDHLSNQVKRGENAGRKLNHQRVVRYLSPDIDLKPQVKHIVELNTDWKTQNLGIAAIVRTADEEYVQSIYALLSGS